MTDDDDDLLILFIYEKPGKTTKQFSMRKGKRKSTIKTRSQTSNNKELLFLLMLFIFPFEFFKSEENPRENKLQSQT
jgi:hypothetical protein